MQGVFVKSEESVVVVWDSQSGKIIDSTEVDKGWFERVGDFFKQLMPA